MFPEFYVSRAQEEIDNHEPVYYKVTGSDNDSYIFWRKEGQDNSREIPFYEVFMEEKNGYGVKRIDKSETPWAEQ